MPGTLFCLARDIIFVLDYNILNEVDHVLASVNTIYIFPDQSKLIFLNKKLASFNGGAITIENTSSPKSQIINVFVNQHDTKEINLISQ